MGNLEQRQGRGLRPSSWWSKKERKAACSCPAAGGRWSGTAVTQPGVCQTSHFLRRLLGSEWFLSKKYVSSRQEKRNSAISYRWPTLSRETCVPRVLESVSGINEMRGAGEGTGFWPFLLQRQVLPLQDAEVRILSCWRYITRTARGGGSWLYHPLLLPAGQRTEEN